MQNPCEKVFSVARLRNDIVIARENSHNNAKDSQEKVRRFLPDEPP
jgi:hypothetical protein